MAQKMVSQTHDDLKLSISVIDDPKDVVRAFDCVCEAFGQQVKDGIWMAMNPGWDTSEGRTQGAERMVSRWRNTTNDQLGRPNTVFLKATLPDARGERVIAGFAIWVQASSVQGHGDPPVENIAMAMRLNELYPGNDLEQRYLCQLMSSLHARRTEVIKQKATATPPAVMILDLCAVDPSYQRRGIARELVQWGITEARRRGNVEAITEASIMGRHVYRKLGFVPDDAEIEYAVDDEFVHRERPSNLFMRTQNSPA